MKINKSIKSGLTKTFLMGNNKILKLYIKKSKITQQNFLLKFSKKKKNKIQRIKKKIKIFYSL